MWWLGWRNLRRNRTRTLITASAIACSLALMCVSLGMGDAMYREMMRSAARTAGGDLLLHADGYWGSQDSALLLRRPAELLESLRAVPGVAEAIGRVHLTGLVSSPRGNAGVRLVGTDPRREQALQDLERFVVEGAFLEPGPRSPIVLGRGVVADLGLELGDRVVVTASDPQGELTRALFRLRGVIETGSALVDDVAAYTTIDAARRALGLGEELHQIGIVLESDREPEAARAGLRAALGLAGAPLELLSWREAMPELVGFIEMDARFNYLFSAVLFVVVGFGIANTFLMMVLERIRELGLLAALGLTPGRIARLIFSETLMLGTIASAIGLAIGYAGHRWLATHGIDLAALSGAELEVSGVMLESAVLRSHIVAQRWIAALGAVFAVVVLASIYPAWRATRVDPVEAMRTYE